MTSSDPKTGSRKGVRSPARRASFLVLLAVGIVVLCGMTAITVDLGSLYLADQELTQAADAAALAGSSHIDGTNDGLVRARAAAIAVAGMNEVRQQPVALTAADMQFGVWTPATSTFTEVSSVADINALRIATEITDIPTPFAAAAFVRGDGTVHATAIAVRPPPEPIARTHCFLPIAVPKCRADALEQGGSPAVRSFHLANDSDDDIAWAHPDNPNAHNVELALLAAANGQCIDASAELDEGDPVALSNGVVASNLHTLRDILRASADPWDADLWGPKPEQDPTSAIPEIQYPGLGVLQGPIAVFDEEGQVCGSVKFNQSSPLDRLAWGVIFDVYAGPGSHKGFQVLLDFDHDFEAPGTGQGGGNVVAQPPGRLVR
jgi:Flp pilus assembly protein TadG